MKKLRELRGEGQVTYDYKYDILCYRTREREYSHSVEFRSFVADIDTEGYVTGMRVMDASETLGMPKYALRSVRGAQFHAAVDASQMVVELVMRVLIRNKKYAAGVSPQQYRAQFVQPAPAGMPQGVVLAESAA